MRSNCPARCGICPEAYETFYGRYCRRLERLVEYKSSPPCDR